MKVNPADLVITLRTEPGLVVLGDPATCAHLWEPHLWDNGRAYCPVCGSFAEWRADPRERT